MPTPASQPKPSATTRTATTVTVLRTPVALLILAAVTLIFEGYDILVLGVTVPSLLKSGWSLTPEYVGLIGSAAVFGMGLGAFTAGTLTDLIGRRRMYLATVLCFSGGMVLSAVSVNPEMLLVARVLVGLGSGGFTPTALSLIVEFSPLRRRNFNSSLAQVGLGIGGVIAALLGIWLVPAYGFRAAFWVGALPVVLLFPLAYARLPESISYLLARGRAAEAQNCIRRHRLPVLLETGPALTSAADRSATGAVRSLFSRKHVRATIVFWLATALCLLMGFGANVWLPQLMIKSGYGITSALIFVVILNIGTMAGSLSGATIADRIGPKPVVLTSFLAAAASLVVLALEPPAILVYPLVLVMGAGGVGTQSLLNSYMAVYYPTHNRGSGLGLALTVGRLGGIAGPIYGGLLLAAGLGTPAIFLAFALAPALALVVIAFGPRVTGRAGV
ncbi:MFS transporter [Amycolatopsis sp. RM579]|uniref:MFS transporter n=1 Tax=Amycolatopsis pithecellobii TaxID=664692 RepID=A0A6N7YVZ6_9PSEU|nr:MFS transporter [Amycolatopsis pithecellobii]